VTDAAATARSDAAPDSDAQAAPAELYGSRRADSHGQVVIHPTREAYLDAVKALTDDGYTMCVDLTAVDYVAFGGRSLPDGVAPERFEVVVNFLDLGAGRRIRLRVQVPADDPTLPTLFDVHPGTEAMEREVYDMFGIEFTDHPDLSRILMPEDWEGHPLRKDYEVGTIPVQFKDAPS
jgi:NADH-quinone oxidoreductase subunit C